MYFNLNRITSIVFVAESLLILIRGKCFSPFCLTHHFNLYELLSATFKVGSLWFISTWSDHFILDKLFTTIKICFYRKGGLVIFLQNTIPFSIYQNFLAAWFDAGILQIISTGSAWLWLLDWLTFAKNGISLKFCFFRKEPCRLFVLQLTNRIFGSNLGLVSSVGPMGTKIHWENSRINYILQSRILKAEILQNSEEAWLFPYKNFLININLLRMIQVRTGKRSASFGGTETVVWRICSY